MSGVGEAWVELQAAIGNAIGTRPSYHLAHRLNGTLCWYLAVATICASPEGLASRPVQ